MAEARGRPIGAAQVRAVAELARLALAEGEAEALARDLGRILEWVQALEALDLDGVEAAYRLAAPAGEARPAASAAATDQGAMAARPALGVWPGTAAARLRPDLEGAGIDRDAALAAAPARDEAFFLVPTVVDRA
jgi:aspartyl-tRNA(Asn)/glutamyl-tRNA(Gln) amidotransferase subunit C